MSDLYVVSYPVGTGLPDHSWSGDTVKISGITVTVNPDRQPINMPLNEGGLVIIGECGTARVFALKGPFDQKLIAQIATDIESGLPELAEYFRRNGDRQEDGEGSKLATAVPPSSVGVPPKNQLLTITVDESWFGGQVEAAPELTQERLSELIRTGVSLQLRVDEAATVEVIFSSLPPNGKQFEDGICLSGQDAAAFHLKTLNLFLQNELSK